MSNADLSQSLRDGPLITPLHCAFAAACMEVEPTDAGARDGSLATAEVTLLDDGNFLIEATSEGRQIAVKTHSCGKCSAVVYEDCHPFNGCVEVLVQEIHES
jgi:hypothetical protein